MDLEKYRMLFVDETADHLAEMSRALAAVERGDEDASDERAIDTLFRMAHSIKGMAASLDYDAVSTLAHRLEDWLEPARSSGTIPDDGVQLVYEIIGALENMVAVVGAEAVPSARNDLIARLAGEAPPDPAPDENTPDGIAPAGTAQLASEVAAPPLSRSVRVRAEAVDRFLAAVGELMQRHAQLESLHRASPFWEFRREFGEEIDGMERAIRELRRRALDIRTTPVRRVFERLPRLASELAHSLGKRVRVDLVGEEVEADRAVLDHLDDPLLHLLRNAVDHGIEAPHVREASGKPAVGTIRLESARVGSSIHLRIQDDGAGIDAEKVRRRAVESGLLPQLVAEDLPLERIGELLFEPGMSTREEVSEVSGRGVGLDAVKSKIEALGGTISLSTNDDGGMTFDIDLPSMVALQRVLILQLSGERVALPAARVEAVLEVSEGTIERVGDEAFFMWKDEPIPLLDLGERVQLPSAGPRHKGNVVLTEARGFRMGLHVDRAIADYEVFVREVPSALAALRPLAGVANLPDGVPVFLLEPGALVEDFV
ncbi:MAG: Hpt domain-containing protein [Deltaproteobacteria bacterium]|nr:Hpt domain-containing protein [Deltaproteobacteria bacterium]MBW2414694.1 Hpt domain-containing protein [Deltaproteobacteria bacterium]